VKVKCTEGKSVGALRPHGNLVRVFVDEDYHYGYWVEEDRLVALLGVDARRAYLEAGTEATFEVEPAVAQSIIDIGVTPYKKARVI